MARPSRPHRCWPRPTTSSSQFYEALQRGDIDRLMARVVRRRRDRLRASRAARAWSARRRSARSFEAMFANGAIDAQPEKVRRLRAARSAVHSVLERIQVMTDEGPQLGLGRRHQRLPEDARRAGAWSLHHASPGTRSEVQEIAEAPSTLALSRHACNAIEHRAGSAAWLPGGNAQTIWPALVRRRFTAPPPQLPARALDDARRRLRRRRLAHGRRTPARAAAGAVPRPRRLVAKPLRAGLRAPGARARLALRGAALSRLLGRAQPRAARLPLGRLRRGRLDPRSACARSTPGRIVAVGVSLGGNALLRWAEEAGDSAHAPCAPSRAVSCAARPGRRRPRDRPRLQPPGLHAHVPAHDEAEGAAQAGPAPGPVRPRAHARGARPVRVRQRLHRAAARLSRHRRLLGTRARPSRTCTASAFRRWCSTRATTRSCRRGCLPRAGEVGAHVTLWQPAHGGHVGFPDGPLPRPCACRCPSR